MPDDAPRPGHATIAGWLVIGGSVILVLLAYQRIASLHTLEVQEELRSALAEPPLNSWDVSVGQLEGYLRVLCMIGAGAATAAAILGWHALRRSTSARLALTALTPLLLVGAFATAAGFSSSLVLLGIAMLWMRPTRDWFAGRPWTAARVASSPRRPDPFAPAPRARQEDQARPSREPVPGATPPSPASPASPTSPPSQPEPFQGEYGAPLSAADRLGTPYGTPAKRPGALVAACVLVWSTCTIVAGFMLLFSLIMIIARDEFFDELERQQPNLDLQGMSPAELATGTFVATAFIVAWCVVAMVLAVLAFRRLQWARVALVVCVGLAGMVLLAATFVSPPVGVLLVADLVTVWLLLRADVTAWFTPGGRR